MIWFWVLLIGGFLIGSVVLAIVTQPIFEGLNKVNDYFEERETPEGRERQRQRAEKEQKEFRKKVEAKIEKNMRKDLDITDANGKFRISGAEKQQGEAHKWMDSEWSAEFFYPDIHYKRVSEDGIEFLRKICPENASAYGDRARIWLDFEFNGEKYFLLEPWLSAIYLKKYTVRSTWDGVDRYVLQDVSVSAVTDMSAENGILSQMWPHEINEYYGRVFVNFFDEAKGGTPINQYQRSLSRKSWEPLAAAFALETDVEIWSQPAYNVSEIEDIVNDLADEAIAYKVDQTMKDYDPGFVYIYPTDDYHRD